MARFIRRSSFVSLNAKAAMSTFAWLLFSTACGDAKFGNSASNADHSSDAKPSASPNASGGPAAQDSGRGDPRVSPVPTDSGATKPFSSLTWFFQCDSTKVDPPKAKGDDDPVIEGSGPFEFQPEKLKGTPITVSGHLCRPSDLPRDIVFVIDTSGSMGPQLGNHDPRVNGTCSRLQAVQSVIQSIPAGTARFSIVTFSDHVNFASSAMFEKADELYNDAKHGGQLADVVCEADGGTNYREALSKAGAILERGRPKATKEIYFVSDGEPDDGYDGEFEATALKSGVKIGQDWVPVAIATVMLAGNDQVLETKIASKDRSGKPMHAYVSAAANLAKVLTDLAANGFESGTLKYRPTGTLVYKTLSLLEHVQGYDFSLPSFSISKEDAPSGLEVLLEYYDRHANRYSSGGKLTWSQSPAAQSGK